MLRIIAYAIASGWALCSVLLAALFCKHAVEEHARTKREQSARKGEAQGLRVVVGGKAP